jgi:hypothetical protein
VDVSDPIVAAHHVGDRLLTVVDDHQLPLGMVLMEER